MSPVEICEVRKQLDEYLCKGPTPLFMGPPFFMLVKKDRTLKMCIDYKSLIQQIRPVKYPLPRIDDPLDQLINARCLSSIYFYTGCY